MGTPGHRKFDAAGSSLPGSMFNSVAEMMSWKDLEAPAPAHPSIYSTWKDTTENDITDVLSSGEVKLNSAEEDSFQIGKLIGFRALEKFVEKAKAVGWAAQPPEVRLALAKDVLARPQIPQRTPAWYAQGKEVLTASEFAKIFGSPRCVSQLVMSKVSGGASQSTNRMACMTCEMGPFDWGIRFEPVVKQILAKKWGVEIAEAGRVSHAEDSRVAASPDGIFLSAFDPARVGRLVEIKCPLSRAVGEGIPFDYWCQMQVQMEVTGIGECDYVEVKIDSAMDLSGNVDGHVWLLQNSTTCEMRYAYTEAEVQTLSDLELIEKIPWRLRKIYTETVARDVGWYKSTAEQRGMFWENVEKARQGQFQVVPGKTVIVTKEPAQCLIVD
jgi:hypothetical protein